MNSALENLVGDKLVHIIGEIFARKGYLVHINPTKYQGVEIMASAPSQKKNYNVYFISCEGRRTNITFTERDMKSAIPDNFELPNDGMFLISTTCRYADEDARRVARLNDISPKKIWYSKDILSQLESYNSKYLIDLYSNDKYKYKNAEELRERFEFIGISVGDDVIDYICNKTYHPERIIAYIELTERSDWTKLSTSSTIEKFIEETSINETIDS